jgi:hypothetical protein
MPDKSLGALLSDLLQLLADLIDETDDATARGKLLNLQRRAAKQLQTLIDETVRKRMDDYKAATSKLTQANAALKTAKQDIDSVAVAITKAAQAISAVAKLAAAL